MGTPSRRKRLAAAVWRLVPQRLQPPLLVARRWFAAGYPLAAPWLALVLLNALLISPFLARDFKEHPYLVLQPSGDLFVLVACCVVTANLRHGAWVRRAAMVALLVLWIFGWDVLIGRTIVHQTPLFYDQLFLLRHLGVLISDLWNWMMFVGLVGALALVVFIGYLGVRLMRYVVVAIAALPPLRSVVTAGVIFAAMSGLMAATRDVEAGRKHHAIGWSAPALGKNLRRSYRMYQDIQRGMQDSPYARYATDYTLTRRPDIHLFFVESYGAVMPEHPKTRPRWLRKTRKMQRALEEDGWFAVSAYTTAPVSGGRSWLAEASVLTGIVVRYEAVFQHLLGEIDRTPNLVDFLASQGYSTFLLAPKDRARPGVELENMYRYTEHITALDLDYHGRKLGWGIIPDQYSLGFAQEYYYRHADGPIFTNFHMVSSHAPWDVVPRMESDWELLDNPDAEGPFDEDLKEFEGENDELFLRMKRYRRRDPKYLYMGEPDADMLDGYGRTIGYDLDVIRRFMQKQGGDQLVIVMGDHQPPLLWEVSENNYDVPIHVFSRDPRLLEDFKAIGFTPGMQLPRGEIAAVGHEALLSLIVRTLVRCCTEPGTPLPPVLPDGVRFAD